MILEGLKNGDRQPFSPHKNPHKPIMLRAKKESVPIFQDDLKEAGYECYGLFCAGCGGIEVEGW